MLNPFVVAGVVFSGDAVATNSSDGRGYDDRDSESADEASNYVWETVPVVMKGLAIYILRTFIFYLQ